MKSVEAIKMFAFGIVIALLAVIAMKNSSVVAEDHATSGDIIALTSRAATNGKMSMLTIIDTKSKHMAVYQMDDNSFAFCASRYYGWDLGIDDLKYLRRGYTVKESEKEYTKNQATKAKMK